MSVFLLLTEFSLFEDCSCEMSKIVTWVNMICSANFLQSFKKERLSGVWELYLPTKKKILNWKYMLDIKWYSFSQMTSWTPVLYKSLFRNLIAQWLGLPFLPYAFRPLKPLNKQCCYSSLPFSSRLWSLSSDLCDILHSSLTSNLHVSCYVVPAVTGTVLFVLQALYLQFHIICRIYAPVHVWWTVKIDMWGWPRNKEVCFGIGCLSEG